MIFRFHVGWLHLINVDMQFQNKFQVDQYAKRTKTKHRGQFTSNKLKKLVAYSTVGKQKSTTIYHENYAL